MSEKKVVAGVDLGPAADNHSMGVLVATKDGETWSVKSIPVALNYQDPNAPYIEILRDCDVIVIDAPLWFESEDRCRRWEKHIIELAKNRVGFQSWKPSQTHALYSHAWRAKDLVRSLSTKNGANKIYEIFPAAWFALTYEHDSPKEWKGNGNAQKEKRTWGVDFQERLSEQDIIIDSIDYSCLKNDELDALPCVFCAILICDAKLSLFRKVSYQAGNKSIAFPAFSMWNTTMQANWIESEFEAFVSSDQWLNHAARH